MTADALFSALNMTAMSGWLLLVFAPRWKRTGLIAGLAIPALLAAVYAAILASTWASAEGGFSSLSGVAALFADRWVLLAGWTHYLAFDLLIGTWEARDARSRELPHLLLVPCLLLTFMFGPAGWLLYLAVRKAGATARLSSPAAATS